MSTSESNEQSAAAVLPAPPAQHRQAQTAPPQTQRPPHYHVVIWNDDDHSFEYVIEMLTRLLNHSAAKAYDIAWHIHNQGKGIACTCHRERAELHREQIASYGPDFAIAGAQRASMRVTLEEVPQ